MISNATFLTQYHQNLLYKNRQLHQLPFNHQMVIIHVKVHKNFAEDVILDGGYGVYIITKNLKV
jgi:hypothetical protein